MSGLRKAKHYNWKDSNLELFGSDLEKSIKKASADTEVAWQEAGKRVGVQVWCIVQFKVKDWPQEDYGKFYSGDSYIILNTFKNDETQTLNYDVHFWIGKYSTQDEYGTAAYKTVELDTFLNDKPVQHREVQGFESELFKSYFQTLTFMEGGVQSGFRHVKPEEYEPRLFHFEGNKKHVEIKEIPRNKNLLDGGDVYILDLGLNIFQWNGNESNKDERFRAMQYLQALKSERNGRPDTEVLEESSTAKSHKFFTSLTDDKVEDDTGVHLDDKPTELIRLSDASGKLTFSVEKSAVVKKSDLDPADVFLLNTCKMLFVWIGGSTSQGEKKYAMTYAHEFLKNTSNPLKSVTCLKEGNINRDFETAFAA